MHVITCITFSAIIPCNKTAYPLNAPLEHELQNTFGQFRVESPLDIQLGGSQEIIRMRVPPESDNPSSMVVEHRLKGVTLDLLFLCQTVIQVLFKLFREFLEYDVRVGNFFTVEFDKWKLTLLWPELKKFSIDVLLLEGRWRHYTHWCACWERKVNEKWRKRKREDRV